MARVNAHAQDSWKFLAARGNVNPMLREILARLNKHVILINDVEFRDFRAVDVTQCLGAGYATAS